MIRFTLRVLFDNHFKHTSISRLYSNFLFVKMPWVKGSQLGAFCP